MERGRYQRIGAVRATSVSWILSRHGTWRCRRLGSHRLLLRPCRFSTDCPRPRRHPSVAS